MPDKMDFEKKLKKIEEIAVKMESGELSLEESLGSYEDAMKIIKECETYIEGAKLRIEKVSADGDSEE